MLFYSFTITAFLIKFHSFTMSSLHLQSWCPCQIKYIHLHVNQSFCLDTGRLWILSALLVTHNALDSLGHTAAEKLTIMVVAKRQKREKISSRDFKHTVVTKGAVNNNWLCPQERGWQAVSKDGAGSLILAPVERASATRLKSATVVLKRQSGFRTKVCKRSCGLVDLVELDDLKFLHPALYLDGYLSWAAVQHESFQIKEHKQRNCASSVLRPIGLH